MSFRLMKSRLLGGIVASAVTAVLPLSTAKAQSEVVAASAWRPAPCPTCPCPSPNQGAPTAPWMPWAGSTIPPAQSTTPAAPGTSTTPPSASTPDLNANPNAAPENAAANPSGQDFAFGGSQGLASGAGTFASPGGYLDDAIPQTMFRLRYEARYGINEFDRAQYMYGTWRELSFHLHPLLNNGAVQGTFIDTKARGSQIFAKQLDDQTVSAYMEVALDKRLSVFANVPERFVHFRGVVEDEPEDQNPRSLDQRLFPEAGKEVPGAKQDTSGLSDIDAGFKYALIACPDNRYLTFQFRTYSPTGDPGLGQGTGHWSVEPSLLLYQRLTDRLVMQGQLTDWVPISAGPGAGNVITYGAGLGYDVFKSCKLRVTPVAEFVGWTVLNGTEAFDGTIPGSTTQVGPPINNMANNATVLNVNGLTLPGDHGATNASGDTIINAKIGVRTYFGDAQDVYVGYGHSLTGDRWYKDILRVEYRLHF
jgi:hypothetical protein